jgi:cytidine deaminase
MYANSSRDYISQCIHAEWAAVKKVSGKIDCVFVYRETKDGSLANARPCLLCQAILRDRGVQTILFSHEDGQIKKEYL